MPDTSTILAGGRQLPVTFLDGTTAPIKVRQLPIRLLTQYDAKQGDEPALVELYCDQKEGWADLLTHESYEAIVALGDEINRGPFERFRDRLADRLGFIKESRKALVDAGLLLDPQPHQRPKPGELLVMPEVKPAAEVPATAPVVAVTAAEGSPSTTSSEASLPLESSQPESEH